MEELKLTFVNVGYGEAALLECPDPAFPGGTLKLIVNLMFETRPEILGIGAYLYLHLCIDYTV